MPPQIAIHLEAPGEEAPRFAPRSRVAGEVTISAPEPIRCREVRTAVGWVTEGRGDRDEADVWETTLHEGELPVGDHRFRFEADLPGGPLSYAGHYIQIHWRVRVVIDVPVWRDITAEKRFLVTLPPE